MQSNRFYKVMSLFPTIVKSNIFEVYYWEDKKQSDLLDMFRTYFNIVLLLNM